MPDKSTGPNKTPTEPSDQSSVAVAGDVEDCTPFGLNPAFISLGVPSNIFKQGVGGDAAS